MAKPMIRIHNIETNEVTDREMNAAEFKKYELEQAEEAERLNKEQAKATAKAELLAKLGITADEAALLLS
jgi:hypothetical protein